MCTDRDYAQPGRPKIDWDDPAAKDALVSALMKDANALLAALQGAELDEQAASAVGLLALAAARMWSPPGAVTGPMGGGGSPARSPKTGSVRPSVF